MKSYVLITGAAGGVGKAFAAECASRGWSLFLTDVRQDLLEPLAIGLKRLYGIDVLYESCDLVDPVSRENFWATIDASGIHFNFLMNVAGMEYEGPFVERSVEELRTITRLSVEAVVEMTSRVLAFREPGQPFHIINMSSLGGFYPMPHKAVYAASKRFLIDYSLAIRQELMEQMVTVTVVCPAGIPTTERAIRGILSQGLIGQLTMMNVGDVTARAVDLALANRDIYIPGLINQVLRLLAAIIPPSVVVRFLGMRWKMKRQGKQSVDGPEKASVSAD